MSNLYQAASYQSSCQTTQTALCIQPLTSSHLSKSQNYTLILYLTSNANGLVLVPKLHLTLYPNYTLYPIKHQTSGQLLINVPELHGLTPYPPFIKRTAIKVPKLHLTLYPVSIMRPVTKVSKLHLTPIQPLSSSRSYERPNTSLHIQLTSALRLTLCMEQ